MKKLVIVLAALLIIISGCGQAERNDTTKQNVVIVIPDGAPSLVFSKMMGDCATLDGYNIDYQIVTGVQGIQTKINDFDIALMPTNLAANLYNQGEEIQLVSVNVHGVLYMIGRNDVTNLSDLIGKVVYIIGQGGTPDLTFQYILDEAEIDFAVSPDGEAIDNKVAIKYESAGTTVIAGLLTGDIEYGILGEPAVTQALSKNTALKVVLDIQEAFKDATGQSGDYNYPQVALVAKNAFLENNADLMDSILTELEDLSQWLQNEDNRATALQSLKDNDSTLTLLTADSVIRSNLYTITANDVYNTLNSYYTVLYNKNANSIGGKIPDNDFYYNYEE